MNTLPEWKRHVVLVLDEMKVKESLVFDKHELANLERECSTADQHPAIATHMQ